MFLLNPVMPASCQQGTRTPGTGTETPCPAQILSLLEMLKLKGLVMSVHPRFLVPLLCESLSKYPLPLNSYIL